ncbi:dihydroxyacetone kinase phosphoryl donor subunit DhaM [Brevibacillus migulae]|uniref:dihydroxyacetone kinase phosphoryl donor subunit DhaM n=1 Tax=Brevibacillus migulae TaxID=1644114 RepID=UPI00106EFBE2|nr:dihydroxyacetone kinase phosphoryl donor subunit DhaM [Brevibacillus migulae]
MNNVGIVLVSHSKELVSGLLAVLKQVQPHVPIAIAGGTDDDEIGTSAQKIRQAIESVYSDAGVVLFFDLGSALMNTELAMEWLEGMDKIRIADAPLVEGSYAAVVESGCGSTLDEVVKTAEDAKLIEKR